LILEGTFNPNSKTFKTFYGTYNLVSRLDWFFGFPKPLVTSFFVIS